MFIKGRDAENVMPLRIRIDRDTCIGCGACAALAPDIFELNRDDGKAQVTEKFRLAGDPAVGEIPEEAEGDAKSAAEGCPVGAIKVG